MTLELRAVDAVEVTIVMDNFVDLLMAGSEGMRRFPLAYDWTDRDSLVAEHGFSALVTVEAGGVSSSILYDAGLSGGSLRRNLDVLQIDGAHLRAIAISHGHADHHGGLEGLFQRYGRLRMPLVIHPDAWRDRRLVLPTGTSFHLPPPSRGDLEREGVELIEERGPTLLVDGMVLVSGQVERATDFEKGLSAQQARGPDGEWEPDPWTWDDQNMVLNVRDRGLVVVSACSHSGAVNVLRNAQRLTGERRIAAFVGGFHLSGGLFEGIIDRTVSEVAQIGVARLVPGHCTAGHCTGWRATQELARALPEAFAPPSVGTVFRIAADPMSQAASIPPPSV